jgi:hypothetical protein
MTAGITSTPLASLAMVNDHRTTGATPAGPAGGPSHCNGACS